MNEATCEKPRVTIVSAYIVLLVVIIVAGLIHLFINCDAGVNSNEYGMPTDQLRMEYYWVLFYIICGTIATLLFMRHVRIRPIAKILVGAAIMGTAMFLSQKHLDASEQLAPIKREFAAAASYCHVVARGEMDCGDKLAKVIAKRDIALAEMGVAIIGEWKVTAPRPQSREVSVAAAYIPTPL